MRFLCPPLLLVLATAPVAAAPQSSEAISGLWCHERNALAILPAAESTIRFAVFSSVGGFFCAADGTAQRRGSAWVYRTDELGPCTIRIEAGNGVTFRTEGEGCGHLCGAGNALDGLRFPAGSRTSAKVDRAQVDRVAKEGVGPCRARR